ncbi:MAG: hypothetical protein K6E52_00710 [Bacteroidaceae bacterium]|nr:hypothetical protein [Bacteroidaceae bacterium]
MNQNFTNKLQEWINTPKEQRNLELGAQYLLQLTNNMIMYKNIMRNIKAHEQFIEFRIKRALQYRLQELTHDEVESMQKQVNQIVAERKLDLQPKVQKTEREQFRAGKRDDHERLPTQIQALYVENASIMQKMRELHLQLRKLSTQTTTCPDSDRYPFLKEIIELDKRYHENWKQYDSYVAECGSASHASFAQQALEETARLEQKNILRKINLAKGRYRKNPTETLKRSILSLYQQLTAPDNRITDELKRMGII